VGLTSFLTGLAPCMNSIEGAFAVVATSGCRLPCDSERHSIDESPSDESLRASGSTASVAIAFLGFAVSGRCALLRGPA
jgi:hypothetical protein